MSSPILAGASGWYGSETVIISQPERRRCLRLGPGPFSCPNRIGLCGSRPGSAPLGSQSRIDPSTTDSRIPSVLWASRWTSQQISAPASRRFLITVSPASFHWLGLRRRLISTLLSMRQPGLFLTRLSRIFCSTPAIWLWSRNRLRRISTNTLGPVMNPSLPCALNLDVASQQQTAIRRPGHQGVLPLWATSQPTSFKAPRQASRKSALFLIGKTAVSFFKWKTTAKRLAMSPQTIVGPNWPRQ